MYQESPDGGEHPLPNVFPVKTVSSFSTLQACLPEAHCQPHGSGFVPSQEQEYITKNALETLSPDQGDEVALNKPLPMPPHSTVSGQCSCASHRIYHHKDCMGRRWTGPDDDRYLSPHDGRLKNLVVQMVGGLYDRPANATWERTTIRNATPLMLRIVCWTMSSVSMNPDQKGERGQIDEESSLSLNPHQASERDKRSSVSGDDWGTVCVKWLPASVILFFLLFIPADLNGEVRNNGFYDKFRYRYWGYSKIPRNPQESTKTNRNISRDNQQINPISERPLLPRYLCFLNEGEGIRVEKVQDWLSQHGNESDMRYIFMAYTSTQFSQSDEDLDALHRIAERAARANGVPAYWIGCTCMPDEDQLTEDVHRISDVVRGAHSLVVIVGPEPGKRQDDTERTELLKKWGNRMWTFPEVLLSPGGQKITVYIRGQDLHKPFRVSKRRFATIAWEDAAVARQLVDHYESSILLTPLELVTLALQCLQSREAGDYFQGDMAYALMGLLRRRPKVDEHDTAFQAFARLSLANDSNKLLERLICILPKDVNQQWHTIDDAWGVNLWDIDPMCQVAGVGEDDTVILSGAFGAPIQWKSFAPVALLTRNTAKRWIARICLRGVPVWFVLGTMFTSWGSEYNMKLFLGLGGTLLALALATVLASPYMLRAIYMGKSWGTQPWFFGFEGHLDIGTIETNIFGVNLDRLTWSPFSSELSRHYEADYKECLGIDPMEDPDVREQTQKARGGNHGEPKIFTLVDTYTMTVTMFRAVRPPVAVLLCGSEGGMQRAVMCSYDWRTQTLYRETVLRMKTLVLEKMSRVDSLRLGLKRPPADTLLMSELHLPTCPERGAKSV